MIESGEVSIATGDYQRVFVTTAPKDGEGNPPSFLVHRLVRDELIAEEVTRRFGTRPNGKGHAWAAYDLGPDGKVPEA